MKPSDKVSSHARRQFCARMTAATGVVAVSFFPIRLLSAAPKLDPEDSVAAAMGYTEDTTKVDAAKFPEHKPEQTCDNCSQYIPPTADGYAPCKLFSGRLVAAKGWCKLWEPIPL